MKEPTLSAYKFVVTLDPADAYLPAPQAEALKLFGGGAFQEVSGLGGEMEVMAYPEGGVNMLVHQLPVRYSWGRITLKRGVVREPGLWSWFVAGQVYSLGACRDGSIMLLTPAGNPAMSWTFHAGLAAKWTGPAMNSMQSTIAIETLEIVHHGLIQVFNSALNAN